MKLEELESNQLKTAMHKTSQGNALSIIDRGVRYIYLSDPVTGNVERRVMGPVDRSVYRSHGMGGVRD